MSDIDVKSLFRLTVILILMDFSNWFTGRMLNSLIAYSRYYSTLTKEYEKQQEPDLYVYADRNKELKDMVKVVKAKMKRGRGLR